MDIEEAKENVKKLLKNANPFTMQPYIYFSIETVLNTMYKSIEESAYYRDLVKLKRKEKEQLKKSLKGQIKKKDLIINEMAKFIAGLDTDEEICKNIQCTDGENKRHKNCSDCIIEYFTNKAENVGE